MKQSVLLMIVIVSFAVGCNKPAETEVAQKERDRAVERQIWEIARELPYPKPDDLPFADHTEAEETVFLISRFDTEVCNGGIDQWFGNPTGRFVNETRDAFLRIGAKETAELVQEAINRFPGEPSPDHSERRLQTRDIPRDTFYDLDEQYYAQKATVFPLLLEYWNANQ